jgi:outer membrane protein TolC
MWNCAQCGPSASRADLQTWGRIRRSVVAAGEEAQATAADLESVKLSLHAELAIDYFEPRSADAQP